MGTNNFNETANVSFQDRVAACEAAIQADEAVIIVQKSPTDSTVVMPGNIVGGGLNFNLSPVQSVTTSGNVTLTAAQMLAVLTILTGGTTPTATTPTAALLAAAVPNVKVGSTFIWNVRNANSGTATLAAGAGVTLATGNTNTVATVCARSFLVVFTNVTAGAEAVTIYSFGSGTY